MTIEAGEKTAAPEVAFTASGRFAAWSADKP
jgi:hypothetical protein